MTRNLLSSTLALAVVFLADANQAVGQGTWRVNVDSSGNQTNGRTDEACMSHDGRYVFFSSDATNLVPSDTNGQTDMFVHDRLTRVTTRVSVDSDGNEGSGPRSRVDWPANMSRDGRYVTYYSFMNNLVPNDTNNHRDVFVHDRETGETTRVSVDSNGNEAQGGDSGGGYITPDGRYVIFSSWATNLVDSDTNGKFDSFLHDRQTGTTTMVSLDSNGNQVNGHTGQNSMYLPPPLNLVMYMSEASNLVPNDTNNSTDIFVKDLNTGEVTRVSVDSNGNEALGYNGGPSISSDGKYVVFASLAENLDPLDNNFRRDVFVHNRVTKQTVRISARKNGKGGNDNSYSYLKFAISADNNTVLFESAANNLLNGDTNNKWDVFTKDISTLDGTGRVRRISMAWNGTQANDYSGVSRFSSDGRFICFITEATNVVVPDTNGQRDVIVVGPHLTLEADDEHPLPGDTLTLTTWRGQPFSLSLLVVVAVNGTDTFVPVVLSQLDADGVWSLSATVPGVLAGNILTLQAFTKDPTGLTAVTNEEKVTF